jgi:hypothetical protein
MVLRGTISRFTMEPLYDSGSLEIGGEQLLGGEVEDKYPWDIAKTTRVQNKTGRTFRVS